MPKSDTWPDGVAVETLGGTDSAGSCDSVVSIHSGLSDASLEQLSAEERECILFLEETIESLEADEDGDRTGGEPDLRPNPGSLAAKIAHLSASLSGSISRHPHDGPTGEGEREHRPVQGCLVPTPLVMAKSGQPNAEPGTGSSPTVSPCPLSKTGSSRGQDATAAARRAGCQDRPKAGLARGPLSYEGLLELRMMKPTLKKHAQSFSSGVKERAKPAPGDLSEGRQSSRPSDSTSQHAPLHLTLKPRVTPPTVAPKPKVLPPSVAVTTQKAPIPNPDSQMDCLGTSPRERVIIDPQQVRREALRKLGLLQDGGTAPPFVAGTLPSATGRPRSRSDLPPAPSSRPPPPPVGAKSVTLERCSDSFKPRPHARTASLGHGREVRAPQPDAAAEPTSQKPLFPNGISAAMVPWNQTGQVRQEALKKLGLLRE
ncbi:specifically androgen-regulated gene protein-like [Anguilla anguilla]|uniref:specifically androgen-regulated gene protein-like n=1 Tax=Anguilla anguilla TaxID=7936 RepID=UPI0015AC5248|nr:specifically androgen-regulated gene protein-like [Anguilla anguilla]